MASEIPTVEELLGESDSSFKDYIRTLQPSFFNDSFRSISQWNSYVLKKEEQNMKEIEIQTQHYHSIVEELPKQKSACQTTEEIACKIRESARDLCPTSCAPECFKK
jgi:hypothetical protein